VPSELAELDEVGDAAVPCVPEAPDPVALGPELELERLVVRLLEVEVANDALEARAAESAPVAVAVGETAASFEMVE